MWAQVRYLPHMWKKLKQAALLVYRAWDNLAENHGLEVAGYLTFLMILALFPYLVLMVSAAGLLGQGDAGQAFIGLVLENLPSDAVAALRPRIEEITSGPPQHLLTFSILGAIWTSSSAVEALRGVLNRAYCVHKPPAYFWRRLVSMGQVLLLTSVLLLVMLVFVFTPILLKSIIHYTGLKLSWEFGHFFSTYFQYIAALVLFGLVAMFYHVLPNIKQRWLAVVPGAVLVVALWMGAALAVSFYLASISNVTLIYGSLSGFIATLIFFYVMNVIFIYGAEFNHELMVMLGHRIEERDKIL